ncbi:MORN repeat protein [Neisseria gonorrhoeae]|uniref:MORN repeat protein n=1 Tax=Neisseria gonorrhoeae TaxID=485 RepID=A0A378VYU9_NEIGO|nr:MORN repeat protein [Neisseria gonorrhoeae]
MLKHLAFLLPAMMFALPAQTAVLSPIRKPAAPTKAGSERRASFRQRHMALPGWARLYRFIQNGKFDGQGVYTVAAGREVFLEPFNSDSTKFRNMALSGTFKQGLAHGRFAASQNGETLFYYEMRTRHD